ncbi:Glycosyl transferase, family 1 [uncultured Caudovirales phage]|uniref:Glycosyl transferase, family 1 n=1 Tax=uncultured Caudovirales phage TaxID=2100421 RepID=A0A6J5MYR9_9CAUD|nr:Glycosyl transferase, family 1 [uncultured Caudovirales phage]
MMRVLCVVDKEGTALDRLAQGVARYHDNIDYRVISVHPKRPSPEQITQFLAEAVLADVIDWQYFRTAEMLFRDYGNMLTSQKHILTHNNPYSIHESDWNRYDLVVGNNKEIYEALGAITEKPVEYVPLAVDADFWEFNQKYAFSGTADSWKRGSSSSVGISVLMVANRIESKKGVLAVAQACKNLGIKLDLVGAISDGDYFREVMATGFVHFHEQISDEKLRDLYYKSTVHVCNSVDNFESGTLPILEAMFCGTPVMTRRVGHVPEIYNGSNMEIMGFDSDNVQAIENQLASMLSDKKRLAEMRDKAWNSVKLHNFERRAYMYQKLYRQVMFPNGEVPVSVVVPIHANPDVVLKCLNAIASQTYKNIELIVVDDSFRPDELNFDTLVKGFSQFVNIPVKYLRSSEGDYGLARARNIGTIEATGDVVVYCDQRMIMQPTAIEEFVKQLKPKYWLYGNKGSNKESFVENFSCAYRKDVINAGMFCERMFLYGGMSQEIRYRIRNQGINVEFVREAHARPVGKSSNRIRRRNEIVKMKTTLYKMELDQ